MYLFRIFRSFLPLHNPLGFGASDFVVLAVAALFVVLLFAAPLASHYLRELSKRPRLCLAFVFCLPIALRLVLLPQSSVPIPSGADDFSFLLLGDTLAHFRLANAAHPLYSFFEAVFILQQPKYASIYPLGQGFFLAFGGNDISAGLGGSFDFVRRVLRALLLDAARLGHPSLGTMGRLARGHRIRSAHVLDEQLLGWLCLGHRRMPGVRIVAASEAASADSRRHPSRRRHRPANLDASF